MYYTAHANPICGEVGPYRSNEIEAENSFGHLKQKDKGSLSI